MRDVYMMIVRQPVMFRNKRSSGLATYVAPLLSSFTSFNQKRHLDIEQYPKRRQVHCPAIRLP